MGTGPARAQSGTAPRDHDGTRNTVHDQRSGQLTGLPRLDGDLLRSAAARAHAAHDFGHLLVRRPAAVLRPRSVAGIAALVRWAADRRVDVAARGQGHSVYGRAQAPGGVVIDLSRFAAVRPPEAGVVDVDAGATWRSVVATTLPTGLVPPVLPNYLDLSVGGTIAVGGVGATTHRYGLVTDTVVELEVVTGTGEVLTCSADQNAGLFDHVRAGLGQVGIITRAVLSLVAAPARVRRYTLRYPDLAGLAADQERLLRGGRADHLQGSVLPAAPGWRYQLELAVFHSPGMEPDDAAVLRDLADDRAEAQIEDLPYRNYLEAFDRFTALLRTTGEWSRPHPWLLTFLPGPVAVPTAQAVLDELTPDDLGDRGAVLFSPVGTAAFRTPLAQIPDGPVVYPFNLVRFVSRPDDGGRAAAMVRQNQRIHRRVRAAGGTLYPVSALPFAEADWADHFGPAWQGFQEARARFDPHGVLTPGYRPAVGAGG
jgi:cytokinin dehydrogenase